MPPSPHGHEPIVYDGAASLGGTEEKPATAKPAEVPRAALQAKLPVAAQSPAKGLWPAEKVENRSPTPTPSGEKCQELKTRLPAAQPSSPPLAPIPDRQTSACDDCPFTVVDALPPDLRAERDAICSVVHEIAAGSRKLRDLPRPRSKVVKAALLQDCLTTHDGRLITAAAVFLWQSLDLRVLAGILREHPRAGDHLRQYLRRLKLADKLQALDDALNVLTVPDRGRLVVEVRAGAALCTAALCHLGAELTELAWALLLDCCENTGEEATRVSSANR